MVVQITFRHNKKIIVYFPRIDSFKHSTSQVKTKIVYFFSQLIPDRYLFIFDNKIIKNNGIVKIIFIVDGLKYRIKLSHFESHFVEL
jgi:hypothetical protein